MQHNASTKWIREKHSYASRILSSVTLVHTRTRTQTADHAVSEPASTTIVRARASERTNDRKADPHTGPLQLAKRKRRDRAINIHT